MIACDVDLLSRYLDGDMSLPARRAVEMHVKFCDPCQVELASLQRVDGLLVALGETRPVARPDIDERIAAAINRRRRLTHVFALSKVMPAAFGSTVAALLVLLSVNSGLLYGNHPGQSQPSGTTIAAQVIERQSAPLLRARRSSAIMMGRTDVKIGNPQRHLSLSEVE